MADLIKFPKLVPLPREKRASLENPAVSLSDPNAWSALGLGYGPSDAGVDVTESTALTHAAVWACVRILSEDVASLPLQVYRRVAQGREKADTHRLYPILHDRPNPEISSFTFREMMQAHLLTWGNAYAEIERDNANRVVALWPITPHRVFPFRDAEGKGYRINLTDGSERVLRPDKLLHVQGLGYDGLAGYSPIGMMRQAIGLSMGTEKYGAALFGNGARAGGVLQHPGKLSDPAAKRLKESWEERHGGLSNAHRIAVLEEGMTFQSTSMPPEDAQFLATRQFQITEICRVFRVPPHMVAELSRATFSNIESQSIEYVTRSLRPWLVRWEHSLNYDLFSAAELGKFYAEFNADALMRGDSTARGAFYSQMAGIGVYSINDIRDKENENPVEGGDQRFVPLNTIPLDQASEPRTKTPTPPADTPKHANSIVRSHARVMADALERSSLRESNAASRALKKGLDAYSAWSGEFYQEHSGYIARAITPALLSLAEVVSGSEPDAELSKFVGEYAGLVARSEVEAAEQAITARIKGSPDKAGEETIARYYEESAERDRARARTITEQAAAVLTARTLLSGEKAA